MQIVHPSDFLKNDDVTEKLLDEWAKRRRIEMIENQRKTDELESEKWEKQNEIQKLSSDEQQQFLEKLHKIKRVLEMVCLV